MRDQLACIKRFDLHVLFQKLLHMSSMYGNGEMKRFTIDRGLADWPALL